MEPEKSVAYIRVDGTDFCVHGDYVREWGTSLVFYPATNRGCQRLVSGKEVALTSYEAFGADIYQAREAARHWCDKARRAWDAVCVRELEIEI